MFTCVWCRQIVNTISFKCLGCNGKCCHSCAKIVMPQGHQKCPYCTTFEDAKNYGLPPLNYKK